MHESHIQPPSEITGIISHLTRDAIYRHLELVSDLDKTALLNTLVPHRDLPTIDPAAYLIVQHNRLPIDSIDSVRTTYDLGVVFGRSLLKGSLPEGKDLPAISDFNEPKQILVDEYLRLSREQSAGILHQEEALQPMHDLERATELFARRCEVILPHLMIDGRSELVRGCYDYLNAVQLLEMDMPLAVTALQRFLGKASLEGITIQSASAPLYLSEA